MFEEGGFAYRCKFYWVAVIENLLVAAIITLCYEALVWLMNKTSHK